MLPASTSTSGGRPASTPEERFTPRVGVEDPVEKFHTAASLALRDIAPTMIYKDDRHPNELVLPRKTGPPFRYYANYGYAGTMSQDRAQNKRNRQIAMTTYFYAAVVHELCSWQMEQYNVLVNAPYGYPEGWLETVSLAARLAANPRYDVSMLSQAALAELIVCMGEMGNGLQIKRTRSLEKDGVITSSSYSPDATSGGLGCAFISLWNNVPDCLYYELHPVDSAPRPGRESARTDTAASDSSSSMYLVPFPKRSDQWQEEEDNRLYIDNLEKTNFFYRIGMSKMMSTIGDDNVHLFKTVENEYVLSKITVEMFFKSWDPTDYATLRTILYTLLKDDLNITIDNFSTIWELCKRVQRRFRGEDSDSGDENSIRTMHDFRAMYQERLRRERNIREDRLVSGSSSSSGPVSHQLPAPTTSDESRLESVSNYPPSKPSLLANLSRGSSLVSAPR